MSEPIIDNSNKSPEKSWKRYGLKDEGNIVSGDLKFRNNRNWELFRKWVNLVYFRSVSVFSVGQVKSGRPDNWKWTVKKLMTLIWIKLKLDGIVRGESRRSLKWKNVKLTAQFDTWPYIFTSFDYPGSNETQFPWGICYRPVLNMTVHFQSLELWVHLTGYSNLWPCTFDFSTDQALYDPPLSDYYPTFNLACKWSGFWRPFTLH